MDTRKFVRYTLFVALGLALLYYTYRDISLEVLMEIGREVKLRWIVLAFLAHLVNHFFRAFRWRLFVEVQGYEVSNRAAFLAEMSGFCMNFVPPRMGEWVRCVVLKRLRGVPISKSLGGVFVERLIDIFLFVCLCNVVFWIMFLGLGNAHMVLDWRHGLGDLGLSINGGGLIMARVMFVLGALGMSLYVWHREVMKVVWDRVRAFFKEVWEAMRQIRRCHSGVVWMVSLSILFFHFMVEYLSFFAIEEINIGWQGALCVFIMMNVGMAAPTPGGIGVYHLGVISTLEALGVEHHYAVFYATITHAIQLFNAFVVGGSSLLLVSWLPSREIQA